MTASLAPTPADRRVLALPGRGGLTKTMMTAGAGDGIAQATTERDRDARTTLEVGPGRRPLWTGRARVFVDGTGPGAPQGPCGASMQFAAMKKRGQARRPRRAPIFFFLSLLPALFAAKRPCAPQGRVHVLSPQSGGDQGGRARARARTPFNHPRERETKRQRPVLAVVFSGQGVVVLI